MSLKAFHIFFISVCAALSVFMAVWGFQSYRLAANSLGLGIGVAGLAGLLVLVPYSRWVKKKFQKIAGGLIAALVASLMHPAPLQACAVCFGDPNSGMSKGIKAGVILLILVVGGVLGGIVSIAVSWNRRAKALEANQ